MGSMPVHPDLRSVDGSHAVLHPVASARKGVTMDFRLKHREEARSHERCKFHCNIILDTGKQVTVGRVLNLSEGGCLVERSVSVKEEDAVQLRFFLPGPEPPMHVPRAAVRWTKGIQFGIEFMELEEKDRVRLKRLLTPQDDPWIQSYG